MTGNEKLAIISLAISGTINIIGNTLLIPILGAYGAAISTSFSMIVWNLSSTIFVINKNKLNPTIMARV